MRIKLFPRLSIFKKMAIVLLAVIIVSVISTIIINRYLFLNSYIHLEEKLITEKSANTEKLINRNIQNLNNNCVDWAHWDDTYNFTSEANQEYIDSNFAEPEETMATLDIELIVFTDKNGDTIYGNYFDCDYSMCKDIPMEIAELVNSYMESAMSFNTEQLADSNMQGIINLEDGPMIISISPVLTSTSEGPLNGTLVMGRSLNEVIESLYPVFEDTELEIIPVINDENKSLFYDIRDNKEDSAEYFKINYPDRFRYSSYRQINDIYGNPSLLLRATGARDIYLFGQKTSVNMTILVAISTILLGLLTLVVLNLYFFRRIFNLSNLVKKIGVSKSLSQRLDVKGEDEISSLKKSINAMLDDLEKSQNQVMRTKQLYEDLFEHSLDGIYRSNLEGQYLNVNNALVKLLGYKNKQELLKVSTSDIYCEIKDRPEIHTSNKTYGACLKKKDGIKIYVEISTRIVFENRLPAYYEGIVRDITERKEYEEKIKYISFHDRLTDLYNRAYFEEEMKRLKKTRNLPLTIIYGDVDSLKNINDSHGHETGDMLLRKIASILKDSFRAEDIIARVGGDEFCIILPNTVIEEAQKIIDRVSHRCIKESTEKIGLSISFGISTKTSSQKNLWKLLKEAEDKMYKNKKILKESQAGGKNWI